MKIKHRFLFTLILGLAWQGYVFGNVSGPPPAANGSFGDSNACTSCHLNYPNVIGGGVNITGLPADGWLPLKTYSLLITVQKPGQTVFGFQLSAVVDATNQQAGFLTPGNERVKIVCGGNTLATSGQYGSCAVPGAIQYAEHSDARVVTSTFSVNWTAPASITAGTVRFNLAADAANGDGLSPNDFTYTRIDIVSPSLTAPPVDLTMHPFTIVDRGGMSIITDGSGPQTVGYSRIVPNSGQITPTGVAIYGFRNPSFILVSETGVPASPLVSAGRIYAEIAGSVNTGIAIANRSDSAATISFSFRNASGVLAGSGSITIAANRQIAEFLNQAPFNVYPGSTFQGTFSFTSSVPVAVVASRGLLNERGDYLTSAVPVLDPSAAPPSGSVVVPHFADGNGWTTQIVLVNPTDSTLTGNVVFAEPGGSVTAVTIAGVTSGSFSYSVPGRGSLKLATAGAGTVTGSGSARVSPAGGGIAPVVLVLFSYRQAGVTITEAGAPVTTGKAFRLYAESAGTAGQPGNIQTGIAVANASFLSAQVTLEITDLNGSSVGISPYTFTLLASGQTSKFLTDIFPALPGSFRGMLRITTAGSGISVIGLRAHYNERQPIPDFLITTTPPSNEATAASSAELLFPQIVNGATQESGYTTQFILFNATPVSSSSGNLRFLKQDGTAFSLNVN
jgi:hypothetical protein